MMSRRTVLRWAAQTLCAALVACSAHDEKTAERSVSPLIGTWTRDGSTTAAGNTPQFTKLTFAADGSVNASYAAAGVGAAIGTAPSVKAENDTYTTSGSQLTIVEGTRRLSYTYRVGGSKLYLTPSGSGEAAVFTKAG
jgi:hypothetical protein